MHTNRIILLVISTLLLSQQTQTAIIIQGDQENPTFSFPIGAYATERGQSTLFIGAGNAAGGNYTIAELPYKAAKFTPLAPDTINLNGVTGQPNPYLNQSIALLSSAAIPNANISGPSFIMQSDPFTLYLIKKLYSNGTIDALSTTAPIMDGSGTNPTNGIIALRGTTIGFVFTALLGNGETDFGNGASGISGFGVIPSTSILSQRFITRLDIASPFLIFGTNLASISNAVELHWDSQINRLFVGLQVAGTNGARAIAVGRVTNTKVAENQIVSILDLEPIAPTSLFSASTNNIVGFGVGASGSVSINKLRTLYTSNTLDNSASIGLGYLIIQGDVGTPVNTRRSVYALPIVCAAEEALVGTLAKKGSEIAYAATTQAHPVQLARCFSEAATTPSDAYAKNIPDDLVAIQVGGADLPYGDIVDMQVLHDTVFVSVETAADPSVTPGVFYSQALLNENNAIVAWTPWQRYGNVSASVTGFSTDNAVGSVQFITQNNTVERSEWSTGDSALSQSLMQTISNYAPFNSLQGFVNFPNNTPGLSGTDGIVGLLATTGNGMLMLGQSGNDSSGAFVPTAGTVNTVTYEDGSVTSTPPVGTKVISFTGGALSTIGSIITAEIAEQASNVRLFVGGNYGVAVLVDVAGNGWDGTLGIGNNFEGIVNGMSFKTIGNYQFVRKLFADGNFLYVLTSTQLDRINLALSDFSAGTLSVTTVASIAEDPLISNGAFFDVIVSGKLALLATTYGLYRVGNDADISTAADSSDAHWTPINLPFSVGPGYSLFPLSTTGLARNIANAEFGNVYVLTLDQGNNRSRIFRLVIQDVSSSAITESTVQLIGDMYQQGVVQYFANPGNAVQQFSTDGSLILFGINKNLEFAPRVVSTRVPLPIDIMQASTVVSLNADSASGSRLVVTNNQIWVNE